MPTLTNIGYSSIRECFNRVEKSDIFRCLFFESLKKCPTDEMGVCFHIPELVTQYFVLCDELKNVPIKLV